MHQTREKSSLAMTHKLDDMVELPKSQSKKTYTEDLECDMVMVKIPRCMSRLDSTNAYDEPIGSLNMMDNEDLGLDTFNHDILLSSREVLSFDEPEPQLLPNFPSLDLGLGGKRGPKPPIRPHTPDSFRMNVVDSLTIHTPPSLHVASFHPKDMYCYYHPCIDDLKKHYGFKPCLLRHSGSLGVDFSNLEMIEDDW
nr:hypothetical protein [Tanacetum cinerariifolium]